MGTAAQISIFQRLYTEARDHPGQPILTLPVSFLMYRFGGVLLHRFSFDFPEGIQFCQLPQLCQDSFLTASSPAWLFFTTAIFAITRDSLNPASGCVLGESLDGGHRLMCVAQIRWTE